MERLQYVDPNRHIYRYQMESTSLPVRDYVGEFRVDDSGDGTSTLTWSAQFDISAGEENEIVEMIESFLEAGVDSLKERYSDHG